MAKKKKAKKVPQQKPLPGMADRRVVVLERAALRYADIRDERMEWSKKESEAKKRVQALMHEQQRKHYQRANIEISLEPEDEKVIVRVKDRTNEPGNGAEPETEPVVPVQEPEEVPGVPDEIIDGEFEEVEEEEGQEEEEGVEP